MEVSAGIQESLNISTSMRTGKDGFVSERLFLPNTAPPSDYSQTYKMPPFCPQHHQWQKRSLSVSSRTLGLVGSRGSDFSLLHHTVLPLPTAQEGTVDERWNQSPSQQLPAPLLIAVMPTSRSHQRLVLTPALCFLQLLPRRLRKL